VRIASRQSCGPPSEVGLLLCLLHKIHTHLWAPCTKFYSYLAKNVQSGREVTVHRPVRYHKLIWITSVRLGYMSVKPFPERSHHLGHGLSRVLSFVHPHTCHQALLDRVTACVSH
jgi:hypothetical protein